jgi:hypothetical protein
MTQTDTVVYPKRYRTPLARDNIETHKTGGSREFLAGMYFRGKSFPWQQTQTAKEIEGLGLAEKATHSETTKRTLKVL